MMTDQELQQLVREAIARHAAEASASLSSVNHSAVHASHGTFQLLRSGDSDGACLIEPAVRCNHCGYCLSYGH
jgi:hypothetical protein